jgi:hypothetical protein
MNEKYRLVAIVVALVVVIAGAAILVRGAQAPVPTLSPSHPLSGSPAAATSVSPTAPPNDWIDPETVTRAFFSAWEDARSHPQDVSNVMPFLLPGSDAISHTQARAKQRYIDHKMAFRATDIAVTDCVVSDGPVIARASGMATPQANLALKHVSCQVSDTGQDTDLSGASVGTHDPVWHYVLVTEVQEYNGLWYVEAWATCEHGQDCGLLGTV